jgi:predicted TIM-barrel fold metal-dependent hydrolase
MNTHCHQLPERVYREFDLDALFHNAYLNWCGVSWDHTARSRQNLLEKVRFHSAFVWLWKGLQELYATNEPLTADTWEAWSERIRCAHADPSYRPAVLTGRCAYRRLILDAYWEPGSDNGNPGLFAPAFRVNAFHFGYSPQAFDQDGNNPYALYPRPFITDLEEYLGWVRDCIVANQSGGCVALKVPLAYDRGLDFAAVSLDQARRAFARLAEFYAARPLSLEPLEGERPIPENAPAPFQPAELEPGVDPQDIKDFQDFLFFWICRVAAELDLPVQIHTGTGQGRRTQAAWLQDAIQKNPATRFVLLHCGYPWIQDIPALVSRYPNVFPDLSMLPLFSTQACRAMLHELIEGATADRLSWGCDTWTPEESFGSLLAFRHVLASVLAEKVVEGYFSLEDARLVIDYALFQNAARFYHLDSSRPSNLDLQEVS